MSALENNRLVVVGFLGSNQCYLNVPRDEAVRRYLIQSAQENYFPVEGQDLFVEEFEFEDEFWAYAAKRKG